MTALAGAEPIVAPSTRLYRACSGLSRSRPGTTSGSNQRRVELLLADPATRPHDQGVLVVDDTGDRKAGRHTAHVARQYLGSVGKTDNGIVAVTSLWASECVDWPVHVVPYTPASRLPKGRTDPAFRTKPQLAADLLQAAREAGIGFRAVVADCTCGDNVGFTEALGRAGVADVLAVKPRRGMWAPADEVHTPQEAARQLAWSSPEQPSDWTSITRRFRDGHTQTWWAADASLPAAGWGPERRIRLVVATTDPPRCRGLPPGTCSPTCAVPAASGHRPSRLPTWPRSCACAACATGSSRATSRSRANSAGPTSRSAPIGRSAGTGSWWLARSRSAGGPGSPSIPHHGDHQTSRPLMRRPCGGRGPASAAARPATVVAWPVTLRRVRGWLTPWVVLGRWWLA
jgi:hypothetical protein